jgi:hypothetical protein
MAGDVVNIKGCSPLKLRSSLTGNYHAICHYSYNLPLAFVILFGVYDESICVVPPDFTHNGIVW